MVTENQFLKAYEENADALFRFFYFRVYDREKAKDCLQETYLRTWSYLAQGKQVKNLKAFLYQVARNLIIDESRKKKAESLDSLREKGFEPSSDEHGSLIAGIDARLVVAVFEELDDKHREVVTLRYVEGFSSKEIAKMIDESENVVSVRIHRAIQHVRRILDAS
ncbi:MAG: RNA polymerase sigma factor [Candidatus Komeilibacteria bacterium]|nr:RNA polymerase sigma factor [Candidatus Komeilibacteria bacterium]